MVARFDGAQHAGSSCPRYARTMLPGPSQEESTGWAGSFSPTYSSHSPDFGSKPPKQPATGGLAARFDGAQHAGSSCPRYAKTMLPGPSQEESTGWAGSFSGGRARLQICPNGGGGNQPETTWIPASAVRKPLSRQVLPFRIHRFSELVEFGTSTALFADSPVRFGISGAVESMIS